MGFQKLTFVVRGIKTQIDPLRMDMKIVTATEMARIEALAIEEGCSREEFMLQAGLQIADLVQEWCDSEDEIVLLAWKGNKSGDGFVAGIRLLEAGYKVRAVHLADLEQCTELCRKFAEKFRRKGGEIEKTFVSGAVYIDALLGTGFSGTAEGVIRDCIEKANASGVPIYSIDLPSGLNGNTGDGGSVIQAHSTITLGLPKIGCFLKKGWNYTGELYVADFGLPEKYEAAAEAVAILPDREKLKKKIPKIVRNRHKYQAGCVVGYAGSKRYSGAAKLASLAAIKSGAGLIKLFYPEDAEKEMMNAPYEVIRIAWNEEEWVNSLGKAFFVGPGLGKEQEKWIRQHVPKMRNVVLDADALLEGLKIPENSICTPHRGEMQRLLGKEMEEDELLKQSQKFCDENQTVLVLKGAPTWIFVPHKVPFLILHGDPGMATAGSGDVLTGLLASLLAQGSSPLEAALLGAMLHALAGEAAAKVKTSYCMSAGDLIEFFPEAFRSL